MSKENKTKYAILGVLSMSPASGYDIKKFCDGSISHFWNENYGHIYPVLKQLEEEGLIEKETSTKDGKLRNVFSINSAGRQRLAEWLDLPPEIPKDRYEFLLKVFFSKDVPVQSMIDRMIRSEALCRSILEEYKAIEQNMKKNMNDPAHMEAGMPYRYMTLRYGILNMEANVDWCLECIALLKKKEEKK